MNAGCKARWDKGRLKPTVSGQQAAIKAVLAGDAVARVKPNGAAIVQALAQASALVAATARTVPGKRTGNVHYIAATC